MICIYNTSLDPYFNMAAEEYLLNNACQDCFMLWRNRPTIVVGKNQNTLSEIDENYVREHDIDVVRRLTGGGAVFHDPGNINFTFIIYDKNKNIDMQRFTQPIILALSEMGITAEFDGRNDLVIDGQKISGNAQHISKNKILHHGTLLFSSSMKDLTGALKVNPEKFKDKAVKSISKRVTNISSHLKIDIGVDDFIEKIMDYMLLNMADAKLCSFSMSDVQKITELRENKYVTWDWNFGKSPAYSMRQVKRTSAGTLEIMLDVQKGIIEKAYIRGDFFHLQDIKNLEKNLSGVRHELQAVQTVLETVGVSKYIKGLSAQELALVMF